MITDVLERCSKYDGIDQKKSTLQPQFLPVPMYLTPSLSKFLNTPQPSNMIFVLIISNLLKVNVVLKFLGWVKNKIVCALRKKIKEVIFITNVIYREGSSINEYFRQHPQQAIHALHLKQQNHH